MDKSRLKELCQERSISITELERTLGMSNGSLGKEGTISSDRLLKLADFFDVSMEYLMGRGEHRRFNAAALAKAIDDITCNHYFFLTEEEAEVINTFRELSPELRIQFKIMTAYFKEINSKEVG